MNGAVHGVATNVVSTPVKKRCAIAVALGKTVADTL